MTAAAGLGLALLAVILLPAGIAGVLCALSRCGCARVVVHETYALLVIYAWGQLAQRRLAPRDPARVPRGVLPVLFVHGIYCNAGVWHRQLRALHGVDNLFTLNLAPPLGSMDRFAQQLAGRVEEVCRAAGTERAIIVGHSMGGLVARAWIARLGGAARAARLVTLGSPHHGSSLARAVPGRCARELRRGSAWLAQLEAAEAGHGRVPLTSIYSRHDEFLAPQDSARLEGAQNIALERLGHLELLLSRRVHALVAAEIAAARGERPS